MTSRPTAQLTPDERRKLFDACLDNPERFAASLDRSPVIGVVTVAIAAFGCRIPTEKLVHIRSFIASLNSPPKPLTGPCDDPSCDARCTKAKS